MRVDFNCQQQQGLFPVVDLGELQNEAIELGEGGLEAGSRGPKQEDHDRGVVDEGLELDLVKTAAIVFVCPRCFPQLQHPVFNADSFLVLIGLKGEASHMPEPVEVDKLELVLEDFHDLFLGEPNKLGRHVCNLGGELAL